jgi:hypothetical protein
MINKKFLLQRESEIYDLAIPHLWYLFIHLKGYIKKKNRIIKITKPVLN